MENDKVRTFVFETRAEANAFVDGVEYVNDSSIQVLGIKKIGYGYQVDVSDNDRREE
jgi:hypothetical protein